MAVTIALACRPAAAADGVPVPEDHCSLKALASLAEKELVPGYTGFDFSGRRTFNRTEVSALVISVIDHYFSATEKFSGDDVELVRKLAEEYRDELYERGYTRVPPAPDRSVAVPLTHWAYGALRDFAARGLLPGAGPGDFAEVKTLTRTRMAEHTAALLEKKNASPDLFNAADVKNIEYLSIEFSEELEKLRHGAAAGAPRPPERTPPPGGGRIAIRGSSNLSLGITKGNKTSISNRLSVETNGAGMKSFFSGNLDNTDPEGPDVDLGHGYGFETTRRLLEFHSRPGDAESDAFLLAGDVNSVDFAGGLVVGALNVKGLFASVPGGRASRFIAFWGEDSGDDELAALRFQRGGAEGWSWGATYLKEYPTPGNSLESLGLDSYFKSETREFRGEAAWAAGAGRGIFMDYSRLFRENLTAGLEFRNYRDFVLAHNSPPMYLGRSGGDGENEKSFYTGLKWQPRRDWTLRLARDHVFTPSNGRRTNVFFSAEREFSKTFTASAGVEKERGGPAAEPEKTVKLKYSGFGNTTLYATWKRSLRETGPSGTTRFDLIRPFLGRDGKLIYSFSRRKTSGVRENTSTFRISRKFGAGLFLSLTYNYSETAVSSFNSNLSWRF